MNLTGLHILLTYQCTFECDHCFVWGSPRQRGVFSLSQLEEVFEQAVELGTIKTVFFEGGEPFLYYALLLEAVRCATLSGFSTGIVSNGYWATSEADARLWLASLAAAGLNRLDVSSDLFHGSAMETPESRHVLAAASPLAFETGTISIDPPTGYRDPVDSPAGAPVTGGGVMYRGRAAEILSQGLPTQPWESYTTCPYEDLTNPKRVHLDPLGNLHLCQGVVIGNLFETPLKQIVSNYNPSAYPIIRELVKGGPARIISDYALEPAPGYVDACHLCYTARQALRARFPEILAPDQMYGRL